MTDNGVDHANNKVSTESKSFQEDEKNMETCASKGAMDALFALQKSSYFLKLLLICFHEVSLY